MYGHSETAEKAGLIQILAQGLGATRAGVIETTFRKEERKNHLIEKMGAELRKMMKWINAK